ncbi:MAG: hypothetical protein F6K28_47385 [Microcoleus sp. SIO2G3]|nr:hypothetical protein [Microcoleus sp. SIO2G3]
MTLKEQELSKFVIGYRLLSESGFAVIDYPEEELEPEAEVGAVWYQQGQIP